MGIAASGRTPTGDWHVELTLVALTGPLRGKRFELAGGEITFGRAESNQLCIDDQSISRRHSLIRSDGQGAAIIVDLDSSNGTTVNNVPVKARALVHGDWIGMGTSQFLVWLEEPADSSPSSVQFRDDDPEGEGTVRLRWNDALYLNPDNIRAAVSSNPRVARDLSTLLRISTAVSSARSAHLLQEQLADLILEAVPAERCAIVMADREGVDEASIMVRDRGSATAPPARVSRTILNRVLQEGSAVLCQDVQADNELAETETLGGTAQVRSLLCVPMNVPDRRLGIIYLDTRDASARFDENDLQLVTAVAGVSAVALEHVRHVEQLEGETKRLRADLNIEHEMIGESVKMRELYQVIARVAPTDSTVLIHGESGTGKELVARALHFNNPRAQKPFAAINCAVLTENLLESELFGHEKGAFTGAVALKRGKLELADGGTLFLDEVGELSPNLQARLLRVLQEREFERVGGTRPIKVDIRILAATNKNLGDATVHGTFRSDFYYRLNVVALQLPPLRERQEDIPLLASYFLQKSSKKCKRLVNGLSAQVRSCLLNYDWPGNVRELENAIERAVVMGSTETLRLEDLPDAIVEQHPSVSGEAMGLQQGVREAKKKLIVTALEEAGGKHTQAAHLLGVHPNYLHLLVKKLGLKG